MREVKLVCERTIGKVRCLAVCERFTMANYLAKDWAYEFNVIIFGYGRGIEV